MKCPSCKTELVQTKDTGKTGYDKHYCPNAECPLHLESYGRYALSNIFKAITAARSAAWEWGQAEAAQVAQRKPKRGEIFDHDTGKVIAVEIRALPNPYTAQGDGVIS